MITFGAHAPSGRRARRVAALLATIGMATVVLPAAASADTSSPLVNVDQFTSYASGNIGASTAGVTVSLELLRPVNATLGDPTLREVAAATATTAADGSWSTNLQAVNPANGVPVGAYTDDEVSVAYAAPASAPTTAIPTATTYDFGASDTQASISADGTTLSVGAGACIDGDFYVNGSDYPVSYTPSRGYCEPDSPATASPAVTDADRVLFGYPSDGLLIGSPVGLPGTGFNGPPTCSADLVSDIVTCVNLDAATFAVSLNGGTPVPLVSTEAANQTTYIGTATVAGLAGGGTLTLDETSPTPTTRHITTLHLATLKVSENADGTQSGTCTPNKAFVSQFGGVGPLCPASGTFTDLAGTTPDSVIDDTSGGSTTVSIPTLSTLIPTADDSVPGSAFTAYAIPAAVPATVPVLSEIKSVKLAIVPHGGTKAVFTGTATAHSDAQGPYETVNVTGLASGLYNADWTLTDINGDTVSYANVFAAQPGGQLPVEVNCTAAGRRVSSLKITCTVTTSAQSGTDVTVALIRGSRTFATDRAVARRGIAHLTLARHPKLARGRYTVEVTASHGRRTGVKRVSLKLR